MYVCGVCGRPTATDSVSCPLFLILSETVSPVTARLSKSPSELGTCSTPSPRLVWQEWAATHPSSDMALWGSPPCSPYVELGA